MAYAPKYFTESFQNVLALPGVSLKFVNVNVNVNVSMYKSEYKYNNIKI